MANIITGDKNGKMKIKPLSLADTPGLCKKTAKCIKKDGHAGKCWPEAVATK